MEFIVIVGADTEDPLHLRIQADTVQTEDKRISFWVYIDDKRKLIADIPSDNTLVLSKEYVTMD